MSAKQTPHPGADTAGSRPSPVGRGGHHAYASKLTGSQVDLDKRTITGVIVMTVGRAFGHLPVDATTLEQFAAIAKGQKIRARENHPDGDEITKNVADLRGYFENFRIQGDELLADFVAYSEKASGDAATKLLFKAHEAPEIFGVSPVFFGVPEKGFARVSKVAAVDFVDIPAGDFANQQLYEGKVAMKFSIVKSEDGKYSVKCDADGPCKAGESYEAEFPPSDADKKAEMDAGEKDEGQKEGTKKGEMAATEGDAGATQKDLTKAGAKAYSAADLDNATKEGRKQAIAYAAEFDATMDAASINGKDREEFRKTHFTKGEKFGIEYVKELAGELMKMRAKAVGEGGAGNEGGAEDVIKSDEDKQAMQRFSANSSLRRGWMKDADAAFIDKPESQQYKAAAKKFIVSRQNAGK